MNTSATRADTTAHATICARPTAGQTWLDPCRCKHLRARHAAATHAAIAVKDGTCTGRNLAGACLWPTCPCTAFTR